MKKKLSRKFSNLQYRDSGSVIVKLKLVFWPWDIEIRSFVHLPSLADILLKYHIVHFKGNYHMTSRLGVKKTPCNKIDIYGKCYDVHTTLRT